jgi:anthranilate synthase component 1
MDRLVAAVAGRPFAFVLDRSERGQPSFAGSDPSSVLVVDGDGSSTLWDHRGAHRLTGSPIANIATFIDEARAVASSAPRGLRATDTWPRTVGYLGYELAPWLEPRLPRAGDDPLGLPLAVLATFDRVSVLDAGETAEVVFANTAPAALDGLPALDGRPGRGTGPTTWEAGFQRVKEAIFAGDIYQANLSRRESFASPLDGPALFARLRKVQRVPHSCLLDYGGFAIVSNSPETFLRIKDDRASILPIKGTRPAGGDDDGARAQLAGDAKERAEHLMIVDLERNDLGRLARTGSVEVLEFAAVQSFATVHHLESTVTALLRDDVTTAEILRATFPCGSITGAPKIRAMEIIAEVEPETRGVYTGALGCWNGGRDVDLAVAIRTAVASRGLIHYWSGGGIVADSQLEREWDETCYKSRALRRALELK